MANHAAAGFKTVRDIIAASHLVENMRGSTIDDPLTECYKRLGSAIIPMDDDSEDYKMIVNYLGKTYEPVKVRNISYSVLVENIFAVEFFFLFFMVMVAMISESSIWHVRRPLDILIASVVMMGLRAEMPLR
ncbi:hypothetical protein POM88_043413 [Heracleum sosnowskyi]|uniref:Uncharacterized protein n=1 Tax=Heracleum sosnowskyi TaxID=360622 RepID=A0AAD8M440_9APIA|nr:hypothetical protein POM88_043413 [Heracleum sosnowskyi]